MCNTIPGCKSLKQLRAHFKHSPAFQLVTRFPHATGASSLPYCRDSLPNASRAISSTSLEDGGLDGRVQAGSLSPSSSPCQQEGTTTNPRGRGRGREAGQSWFSHSAASSSRRPPPGAPPAWTWPSPREEEIKTRRGSEIKEVSSSEGSCSQAAVSLETHGSGLESPKAAAAKLHSPNMENTGPQPQPSGSLGTV